MTSADTLSQRFCHSRIAVSNRASGASKLCLIGVLPWSFICRAGAHVDVGHHSELCWCSGVKHKTSITDDLMSSTGSYQALVPACVLLGATSSGAPCIFWLDSAALLLIRVVSLSPCWLKSKSVLAFLDVASGSPPDFSRASSRSFAFSLARLHRR